MNLLGLLADIPAWRRDAVGALLMGGLPEGADVVGLRAGRSLEEVCLSEEGGALWIADDGDAPVRLGVAARAWDADATNDALRRRAREYRRWLRELHGANCGGRVDLGELLDAAWRFVGHSFVLFDGGFDLLAYAGDDVARSAALAQTIEQGYAMGVSAEHQREYRRLQAKNPLGFSTVFQEGERLTRVWARTVRLRSGRSCQLHVMGLEQERLGVRELVEDVVVELRIMLERLETGGDAPLNNDYVQALVTRRVGNDEARRRARFFGWGEEDGYRVVRVVSVADQVAPTRWGRWRERVAQLMPRTHGSVMGDGLTLVVPTGQQGGSVGGSVVGATGGLDVLGEFLVSNRLTAGVSDVRLDLGEAPDAYEEACVAVDRGVRDGLCGLRCFDECRLTLLVEALEGAMREHNLVPAYLQAMRSCDAGRGSAYAETLETYVACRGSKAVTCGRLAIHRSTLDYRLERMRELFGVDPDDERVHWHMGMLGLVG